jgi:hypothetical protein
MRSEASERYEPQNRQSCVLHECRLNAGVFRKSLDGHAGGANKADHLVLPRS